MTGHTVNPTGPIVLIALLIAALITGNVWVWVAFAVWAIIGLAVLYSVISALKKRRL